MTLRVADEIDVGEAAIGAALMAVLDEIDPGLLVGPNWAISGPAKKINPLERKLGGELVDAVDAFGEYTDSLIGG